MNFLAHLCLSGSDEQVMIGNFIGDHVKGNKYEKYPDGIRKGILLHRRIDFFTDNHEITKQSKERLRPYYGKYAGIVIDLFYDHFLAKNWSDYSNITLEEYAKDCYRLFIRKFLALPREVQKFVPFVIKNKRLTRYAEVDGIRESLAIMSNYSSLPAKTDDAIKVLLQYYSEYDHEFTMFWKDLQEYVNSVEIEK